MDFTQNSPTGPDINVYQLESRHRFVYTTDDVLI